MPTYQIEIYTGSPGSDGFACAGGTVYLTLYGTEASSGELVLGSPNGSVDPGARGRFHRRVAELGTVNRLYVRYDDCGLGSGCFLDRITIRNEDTYEEWTFPCRRWLARHEDDGEIERTLDAA